MPRERTKFYDFEDKGSVSWWQRNELKASNYFPNNQIFKSQKGNGREDLKKKENERIKEIGREGEGFVGCIFLFNTKFQLFGETKKLYQRRFWDSYEFFKYNLYYHDILKINHKH